MLLIFQLSKNTTNKLEVSVCVSVDVVVSEMLQVLELEGDLLREFRTSCHMCIRMLQLAMGMEVKGGKF